MKAVKLNPKYEQPWQELLAALTFATPAYTHLMYSLLDPAGSTHTAFWTDDIPFAGTDGKSLLLNPEAFFGKGVTLANRMFVVAHEITHVALEHIIIGHGCRTRGRVTLRDGKSLPYVHMLMNQAMDYVINDMLIAGNIGKMPSGEHKGFHDPKIATADSDIFDVYAKLFKQADKIEVSMGGGEGEGKDGKGHGGGFCQHEAPGAAKGQDAHSAAAEHNPQQLQAAVAGALHAAKLMGKLPGGLERLLGNVVNPKVNWKEHIRAMIARKLGGGGYDWRKGDRQLMGRNIFAPSRSGFGTECVVCAVDTSGSIGQAEYDLFFGEVAGLLEDVKPRRLILIACDAKVQDVHEFDSPIDLRGYKLKGGGGTSFVPVFDEVAKMGVTPDALLYLTDGYGAHAPEPTYPVIWGNISTPGSVKYPYGDVVDIPRV